MDITYSKLKEVYADKNYKFFEGRAYNLNIFGIRSENSISDKFDDWIGVAYTNQGREIIEAFPATTDPGKHWLQNPMRKEGCIIMVPGQYSGCYKVGMHKDYEALEQVRPMRYVRDNNKDSKLDFDLYRGPNPNYEISNAKTNLHRASKWKKMLNIGLYSAGCQVIQSPDHFDELMAIAKYALRFYPNSFTYTLFEELDFKLL